MRQAELRSNAALSRQLRRSRRREHDTLFSILAVFLGLLASPVILNTAQELSRKEAAVGAARPSESYTLSFTVCDSGPRTNCVVDGDTFWLNGQKIRIADIDTPEIHPSRCAYEEQLGQAAKWRLLALLNAGPFELVSGERDEDIYGRALRVVSRGGVSLGAILVREGLARSWEGHRRPWCG